MTGADEKLDTKAAAELIGVSEESLRMDRTRRRLNIPYYKIGRKVVYKRADLDAFLERCRVGGES